MYFTNGDSMWINVCAEGLLVGTGRCVKASREMYEAPPVAEGAGRELEVMAAPEVIIHREEDNVSMLHEGADDENP
jgi:hypothetical protein